MQKLIACISHFRYVSTDMTKKRGVKTPDDGAKTPVMLALEDIGGRTGDFWKSEKVAEW